MGDGRVTLNLADDTGTQVLHGPQRFGQMFRAAAGTIVQVQSTVRVRS